MEKSTQKVLFVCSEIYPYVPEDEISAICRYLPQRTQEKKKEIRAFMPRYGCINERRNQLHEVIRLSGMNLIIAGGDHPLIIKVASIAAAHTQVYFIDNEDYFKRKQLYADEEGNFFEDNDERAIFFARGVLETVKKLRWSPDIIHCSGWISHLLPLYLKRAYRDDPIFSHSKVVLSLHNDIPTGKFSADFASKIYYGAISDKDVELLRNSPDGINLAKTAAKFSDGVVVASDAVPLSLVNYCKDHGLPVIRIKPKSIADGSYLEEYNAFYDSLVK